MNIYQRVATHSGIFHADELMALSLYKVFTRQPALDIVRVARDQDIPEGYLGIDIGSGYLDHHQREGVPTYADGTKYCAANLVVQYYGWHWFRCQFNKELSDWAVGQLQQELYPIALQDNYGAVKYGNTFSCFVKNLNGTLDFESALKAVEPFAQALIARHLERARMLEAHPEVLSLEGEIADLGFYLPLDLFPSTVRFVVCESPRGGFNVTSRDSDLWPVKAVKGEEGCTFVHATHFLAVFENRAQALACARKSL